MFLIYNLIFILFAIVYFPFFLLRLRSAQSKKDLLFQRFGFFNKDFAPPKKAVSEGKRIWLHAVSVGEVLATKPFVETLLREDPSVEVFLSTVTPTGNAVAEKTFGDKVRVFYFPYDISFITTKVVRRVNPDVILLMETELWPNLILSAAKQNVPVGIINGRFSPKSFRGYYRFKNLIKPITSLIRFASVQTESYKRRFIRLGFDKEKVFVTGNLKFDIFKLPSEASITKAEWSKKVGFPEEAIIWIAASTHDPEEAICLKAFVEARKTNPALRLIIAPRHIDRIVKIAALVKELGLKYKLASPVENTSESDSPDVYLLNTFGELSKIYAVTDFIFIGGTLVPHGGQNPLEGIYWKKAILFGPSTYNFRGIYETLEEEGAGVLVRDKEDLLRKLQDWLARPSEHKQIGELAFEIMESLKGASEKNCRLVFSEISS